MANNKNMINMNGTSDPFYRYLMPPIQIKIEGNNKMIKTIILNIQQIAICTKTSSDYVITFLGQELSVNYKYDKDTDKYYISGKHEIHKIQELIFKYINNFIICKKCKIPETTHCIDGHKKNISIILKCNACNHSNLLDNTDRFVKYMISHPIKINNQESIQESYQENIQENKQENNLQNRQENNLQNRQENNLQNSQENNLEDNQDIDVDNI